jgi:hypothetical protein
MSTLAHVDQLQPPRNSDSIERKRFLTRTELSKSPILNERVKPAWLNPLVKHVTASADIKWILLGVGIAGAIFAIAYI